MEAAVLHEPQAHDLCRGHLRDALERGRHLLPVDVGAKEELLDVVDVADRVKLALLQVGLAVDVRSLMPAMSVAMILSCSRSSIVCP